jgi:RNA polymerase sigma-70 factor (ECF subfamily)
MPSGTKMAGMEQLADPSQVPDADLVRLAQAGDLSAFEALTSRHETRVYTLVWRILRHPQDAEDATQQTFLSVLEHLSGFRGDSTFSTWLLRIATHAALKVLRRRKRGEPEPSDEAIEADPWGSVPRPEYIADWRQSPEELVHSQEVQRLLNAALEVLDEKHRAVFLLRDVEGLSIQETAQALGMTAANVKVRLLRARLRLREELTRKLGDPETRLLRHQHH